MTTCSKMTRACGLRKNLPNLTSLCFSSLNGLQHSNHIFLNSGYSSAPDPSRSNLFIKYSCRLPLTSKFKYSNAKANSSSPKSPLPSSSNISNASCGDKMLLGLYPFELEDSPSNAYNAILNSSTCGVL